jgi:hypothetical protein
VRSSDAPLLGSASTSLITIDPEHTAPLASFRKLDDPSGDDFIAEVTGALNGRSGHFECDAHDTDGLRIEGLAERCETKKRIKIERRERNRNFDVSQAARDACPCGKNHAEETPR